MKHNNHNLRAGGVSGVNIDKLPKYDQGARTPEVIESDCLLPSPGENRVRMQNGISYDTEAFLSIALGCEPGLPIAIMGKDGYHIRPIMYDAETHQ